MTRKHGPPAMDEPRVVGPGFHARVFAMVRRIPPGKVATYGQIAALLGSPRVARQVGWALAASGRAEHPVPWHRVVNASGAISQRGGEDGAEQRARLQSEGVSFGADARIDLRRYGWVPPDVIHDSE